MDEKQKKKINARKFVQDFNAGKNDDELMAEYGLTRTGLDRLLSKLVDRGLMQASDLYDRPAGPASKAPASEPALEPVATRDRTVAHSHDSGDRDEAEFELCPQCGAEVSKKALTCPECGHVLPGEERWSQVEPDVSIIERIPPAVIGAILAIPVGIAIFIFFWFFALPAQEKRMNKRANQLMQETNHKAPMEHAQSEASAASLRIIEFQLQRLLLQEVFISASKDYYTFTAGPAWAGAPNESRMVWINTIGRALKRAKVEPEFEIVDGAGNQIAFVTENNVEFIQGEGFTEYHTPNFSSDQ